MRQGASRDSLVLGVVALAASCALETGGVGVDDAGQLEAAAESGPVVGDDDGATDASPTVEDAPPDVPEGGADLHWPTRPTRPTRPTPRTRPSTPSTQAPPERS